MIGCFASKSDVFKPLVRPVQRNNPFGPTNGECEAMRLDLETFCCFSSASNSFRKVSCWETKKSFSSVSSNSKGSSIATVRLCLRLTGNHRMYTVIRTSFEEELYFSQLKITFDSLFPKRVAAPENVLVTFGS